MTDMRAATHTWGALIGGCILFPAPTLWGWPIKIGLLAFAFAGLSACRAYRDLAILTFTSGGLAVSLVALGWNHHAGEGAQLIGIVSTALLPVGCLLVLRRDPRAPTVLSHWITVSASLYCAGKIVLGSLSVHHPFFTTAFVETFSTKPVILDIGAGWTRINLPADSALPAALCLLMLTNRPTPLYALASWLFCSGIILAYSRYWFAAAACAVASIAPYHRKLPLGRWAAILLIPAIMIAWMSLDRSTGSGSLGNSASDQTRTEQIVWLYRAWGQSPWIGHGLGASIDGFQRNSHASYSYEVQWLALGMQLGIVGLTILATCLIVGARCAKLSAKTPVSITLAVCWGLAGFLNPYCLSSQSGAVLATIVIIARFELALLSDPQNTGCQIPNPPSIYPSTPARSES